MLTQHPCEQDWLGQLPPPHALFPTDLLRQPAASGAPGPSAAGAQADAGILPQGQSPSTATVAAAAVATNNANPPLSAERTSQSQDSETSTVDPTNSVSAVNPDAQPNAAAHNAATLARSEALEEASKAGPKQIGASNAAASSSESIAKADAAEGLALKPGFLNNPCSQQLQDPASTMSVASGSGTRAGSSSVASPERTQAEMTSARSRGAESAHRAAKGLGGGLTLPARKGPKLRTAGRQPDGNPGPNPSNLGDFLSTLAARGTGGDAGSSAPAALKSNPAASSQVQAGVPQASSQASASNPNLPAEETGRRASTRAHFGALGSGQQEVTRRGQAGGAPPDLGSLMAGLMGGGNSGNGAPNGGGIMNMVRAMPSCQD